MYHSEIRGLRSMKCFKICHIFCRRKPTELFFISCNFTFSLMNVYKERSKVAQKRKKSTWVLLCIKYSTFWIISLKQFVECKPIISFPPLLFYVNHKNEPKRYEFCLSQKLAKLKSLSNCMTSFRKRFWAVKIAALTIKSK